MTERRELSQIPPQLDGDAALGIVASVGGAPAVLLRAVWYPYYRFEAGGRVPALFMERSIDVTCLVDARRGFASTADTFRPLREAVPADAVLETRLSPAEARRSAGTYLRHAMSREFRCIADFGVEPGTTDKVYRKFWLIRCEARVTMVDSVTGSLHVIRQAA